MRVDFSDFQNFFDLATGHRKYEANRAVGLLLSSLFSLLSSRCVRPSRLRTRRGQGHFDCICARDSGQRCLGHCKYAAILAVEFHPVKMDTIWPAALPRATRGRPRSRKQLFKKASQLQRLSCGLFCPQRRGHETP